MAVAKSILPIASIPEAFTTIARLDAQEAAALQTLIEGERSFWPASNAIERFSETAKLAKSDVETLLSILRFVYDRLGDRKDENRQAALEGVAADNREDTVEDTEFATLITRLTNYLDYSDVHDKFRKLYRLERGFLPVAAHFETLVDLRPDFDEDATDIVGFIPVVSMRIKTLSTDPTLRSFSFTMPLEQVAALTKCVERMNAKLSKLTENLATIPPAKK